MGGDGEGAGSREYVDGVWSFPVPSAKSNVFPHKLPAKVVFSIKFKISIHKYTWRLFNSQMRDSPLSSS